MEWSTISACPIALCALLTLVILKRLTLRKFVSDVCVCMFYVCEMIGLVDWLDRGLRYICKKSLEMCICLRPEFDCPEVTLCGWQDINIQLLLLLLPQHIIRSVQYTITNFIKKWTQEAIWSLQGCFDCTDWATFSESCANCRHSYLLCQFLYRLLHPLKVCYKLCKWQTLVLKGHQTQIHCKKLRFQEQW